MSGAEWGLVALLLLSAALSVALAVMLGRGIRLRDTDGHPDWKEPPP